MTDRAATARGCARIQININLPALSSALNLLHRIPRPDENILSKYTQFTILFSFN